MARIALLFLIFALPALVCGGRPVDNKFLVQGKVYCDTCRAGFETSATTYVSGAKVRIECRVRSTMKLIFTQEATTDSSGCYEMPVVGDHNDQVCEVALLSSPQKDCATISQDRDRAMVILTANNGMVSEKRNVNSIAFVKDQALAGCDSILMQYQESDD